MLDKTGADRPSVGRLKTRKPSLQMLNRDQVRRLGDEIAAQTGVDRVDHQFVSSAIVTAGEASSSIDLEEHLTAGRLADPAFKIGLPFDAAVLDGVGHWDVHAPVRRLLTADEGRIIGVKSVVDGSGVLFHPAPANQATLQNLAAHSREGSDGFLLVADGGYHKAIFAARKNPRHYDGSAMFFHNVESANYGSFFFRQLPQMIYARENLPEKLDYYVVGDRTPWFFEALDLLGLPSLPVFVINEVAGDLFSKVYLTNEFDAEAFLQPETTKALRALVQRYATGSAPEKLYVSRGLSGVTRRHYRHMVNEDDVEALVKARGYEVVYPETLTLKDQIRKFAKARMIIGPSGSGMFNAAFSPQGASILDIETYHNTVRQHAKFYCSQGHRYGFLFAGFDPADDSHPIFRRSVVDLALLDQAIDRLETV